MCTYPALCYILFQNLNFAMAWIPDNSPKTVILSTQAHCEECKYNAQSMLRKVQGVYSVAINADRNTITVTGTSAPKELIETLIKVSQDVEFCVKPPPHVPPSSCPANITNYHQARQLPPNNFGLRTCAAGQGGCCGVAPPKKCCACTGTGRGGPCHYSYYHGHGRY